MLNGQINLMTGTASQSGSMPPFFGSFNPRQKIPSSGKPGGIETTKGTAVLYRSQDKTVNNFNIGYNPQNSTIANINLYVTAASYGYEVQGSEAFAKYYQRFYPISSVIRKATIQGIARNEYEYEDLAFWIRDGQYKLAQGTLDFMGLYIPASGINAFGFIPNFHVKIGSEPGENPNPIPFAIQYQFDFIITEDATDSSNGKFATTMQGSASYSVTSIAEQGWIKGNVTTGKSGVSWRSIQGQYTDGLNFANKAANIPNTVSTKIGY